MTDIGLLHDIVLFPLSLYSSVVLPFLCYMSLTIEFGKKSLKVVPAKFLVQEKNTWKNLKTIKLVLSC